ncbi:MAG: hypothetical protein AB7F86_14510 [Bdellovibrionales bacterium]
MNKLTLLLAAMFLSSFTQASPNLDNCSDEAGALVHYEDQILKAAQNQRMADMAHPLACILKMQAEDRGMASYLAASFLRPLMGGEQTSGLVRDRRYKTVAKALEQLSQRAAEPLDSFVGRFSEGDWKFYGLFCEQGDTQHCSVFLPSESEVIEQKPLLAAASILRLRQAYRVLQGDQRDLIEARIRKLHKSIPRTQVLQRKFIDKVYTELFESPGPLSFNV